MIQILAKVSCGNLSGIPKKIPNLTSDIFLILEIAVPVILVIMGMLDMFKAITADKEDEMAKARKVFFKRLITGAIVFFVFAIVKFVVSVLDTDTNSQNIINCMDCFINGDCNDPNKVIPQDIKDGEKSVGILTYDSNGKDANNMPGSVEMRYNDTVAVSSNIPTAAGYKFVKWCTNKDGLGSCYLPSNQNPNFVKIAGTKAVDITLYAIWEKDTIQTIDDDEKALGILTYDSNDKNASNMPKTEQFRKNDLVTLSSNIPTATGYKFIKWCTNKDGSGKCYFSPNGSNSVILKPSGIKPENITLYAIWEKDTISASKIGSFTKNAAGLNYFLYVPEGSVQGMPLVIFLHGRGEQNNIGAVKNLAPVTTVVNGSVQGNEKFIFLAPASPGSRLWHESSTWNSLIQLIDLISSEYSINTNRIYLTGFSAGGCAVWGLVNKYPNKFRAAVPVSCAWDITAKNFKNTPIYAISGGNESYVSGMQNNVNSINKAGGNAKFKAIPNAGHAQTQSSYSTKELYSWLLSQ